MNKTLGIVLAALGCVLSAGCDLTGMSNWTYHCGDPVPAGGTCIDVNECATGLRCSAGRCVALAGPGQTCADPHDCVAGYSCFATYTNSGECMATTCSESGRDTGNCTTTSSTGRSCAPDLTCRNLEVCALNSTAVLDCRPTPGEGGSCDGFINFACADGFVCELTSKTCIVPRFGGTCGIVVEAPDNVCGPNLGCDAREDGSNVCIARVAEGGACNTESCQAGLHCSTSTRRCERDQGEGSSCSAGNECGVRLGRSLDCAGGKCTAIDERGAKCWPGRYGCVNGLRCLRDR